MVGLLLAGIAVAKRFGTVPGVILCALAAGEVPGSARRALPRLGLGGSRRVHATPYRGTPGSPGLIALATMEAASLLSGTGWGWVRTTTTADATFTGVTPVNVVARAVSIVSHIGQVPISTIGPCGPCSASSGSSSPSTSATAFSSAPPKTASSVVSASPCSCWARLGPIVWPWYVTWGIIGARRRQRSGRLRTASIVISTFWAFAGMTSVHNIYVRMLHTFVLTDLLLVALLLGVAITPLGQFVTGQGRAPPALFRLSLTRRPARAATAACSPVPGAAP